MKKLVIGLVGIIAWLTIGGTATAQEVTCADLKWGDWVAERPYIENSCAGVVEKGGVRYAKFNAQMNRLLNNGDVSLRIVAPDGSWEVDTFRPPRDFLVETDGGAVSFSDVPSGKDIRIYVPEGRFSIVSIPEADEPVIEAVVVEEVIIVEEEPEMPTTASPLPLIGLAGGLFVVLGGLVGAMRRRG